MPAPTSGSVAFFAYLGLVWAITWPRRSAFSPPWGFGDILSYCFALCAALCIPWGGVAMVWSIAPSVPSYLYFPFFSLALICAVGGGENSPRRGAGFVRFTLAPLVLFFTSLGASLGLLHFLVLKLGVPGERFTLESLAMLARLQSLYGAQFWWGMALMAGGLWGGFCAVFASTPKKSEGPESHNTSQSFGALAFSFAAFLAVVFLPVDALIFENFAPPFSVIGGVFLLFFVAFVLANVATQAVVARVRDDRAYLSVLSALSTAFGIFLLKTAF